MTTSTPCTFIAHTKTGPVQVTGTLLPFGLVLHPQLRPDFASSPPLWTISEPITGRGLVYSACSRYSALHILRCEVIENFGSPSIFRRFLAREIMKFYQADAAIH